MRKLLVLLSAVALMVAFTVPAIAADKSVSFYGRMWLDTYMENDSKEWNAGYSFDDTDLVWNMEGNGASRFGARFKWDNMSANIEIRPFNGSMYRQWWGAWNFGGGSLLVGHTWDPLYINTTICGQCEAGGSASGYGFWVGNARSPQIRLTMGGLTAALLNPYSKNVVGTAATHETDTTLPKLQVTYALKLGSVKLVPFFGYNTYDEVEKATDKSYGIDGMAYGITAKAAFGPGFVNGQVWMTKNGHEYGDFYDRGGLPAFYDAGSDSIKDSDAMGFALTAGMKMSDTMSFEVGYGTADYEVDRPGTWESCASSMYAQLNITIAKGFMVTPEIGVIDKGDITQNGVKTERGDMSYFGATWKIHF